MPDVDALAKLAELREAHKRLQDELIDLKITVHTLRLENTLLKDVDNV